MDRPASSAPTAHGNPAEASERHRSNALLRATLEATADGIVVLTPDRRVLLRNEQFLRMWNIPPEFADSDADEIIRYVFDQLQDPEEAIGRLDELLSSPYAEGFDRVDFKDGRVYERYTGPVCVQDGVPARVLAFRDITARVAAEREAREAKEVAEAANRAKSDFLDNVSHEIRTPLNGVLGLTRLLLAEQLTARQRKYVELADASASSLLNLIEDLLDLGKIESGRMELDEAPFDLHDLLRELDEIYRVRAQEKGIAFSLEVDARVPQALRGDATRLRQVLHNLLSNALKFTTQGEFGLIVGRAAASRGNDLLRFTVFDTGIGIAPEVQQRLFTRFTQADRATSRRFGGTGLGLAIVKQLCDMMGGSILLQSEPGRGSSFRCELPFVEVPFSELAPAPVAPRVVEATPRHATRVLVAEDNATNQVVVRGLLAQAGYHDVTVVGDGQEALDAASASEFELALMDCRMPRMDGYEAARRLRAQGFTAPIIALTANAARGERERCLAWGMNEYLSKPVDPRQLAQVLAEWTGNVHATASVSEPVSVAPSEPAAPPPPPPDASPRALALERLGGDEELLAVAVTSFREQAPRVMQWAADALATGAAADLRRHLHSLAGSASMVGAQAVQQLAKELEAVAEAGRLEEVGARLPRLSELLADFVSESASW
jgi:signal transduction histidine kinase/DNA-binding NarL/FixJ family response regulator